MVKRNQASIGAHAEKEVIPEVSDELSLNGALEIFHKRPFLCLDVFGRREGQFAKFIGEIG